MTDDVPTAPKQHKKKHTARRVRQRAPAREHEIKVRLSNEEYDRLKAKAALVNKPPAVFLREHFDEVLVRHRGDEQHRNVLLNRWNANLNMVAKWVNTYRELADVRTVIRQLRAIERELVEIRRLWSRQ